MAQVDAGVGTFVSFSTQPGNVALDGTGRNSPFAGALTKRIKEPGRNLNAVMIEVRKDVLDLRLPVDRLLRLRPRLGPGESAEPDPANRILMRLVLPLRLQTRGGRTEVVAASPPKQKPDAVLIAALRAAHRMLAHDRSGAPILEVSPETSHRRRLIRLAFLAPDLQHAILAGEQPEGLTLSALMDGDLPLSWAAQRRAFGTALERRARRTA